MKLAVFFCICAFGKRTEEATGTMKALILPVAIAQLENGLVVIEDSVVLL